MKRSAEQSAQHAQKKHKHNHGHSHHHRQHPKPHHSSHQRDQQNGSFQQQQQHSGYSQGSSRLSPATLPHSDAISKLPPPTSHSGPVPSYIPFTIPSTLPLLPPIKPGDLAIAPFKHKSTVSYDRNTSTADITYERLEFLGDAYIELIASRLIFERFIHLPAGQQSQLRELLVKNETLAEYSRAYGFDRRIEAQALEKMLADGEKKNTGKGNKGFNKILGDVFEAYVAAVILSDNEDGFAVVEKWLTGLWAPKLIEAAKSYARSATLPLTHASNSSDPLNLYNPAAKAELQKRVLGKNTTLSYEPYQDPVELKGDQLGQNRHFVALYLTGYGHERKLLGKGEGRNKVEAGNWAATEAMWGECKAVVEECEEKLKALKEEKARIQVEAKEEGQR